MARDRIGDLSNIENSQLEWLASISPRFEAELRRRQSEENQTQNKRTYLKWLADVAPERAAEIRHASGIASAPSQELLEFGRSIATDRVSFTCEQVWDESKHRRIKSGRNAGQFTFANGSAAGGTTSNSKNANDDTDQAGDPTFQFAGWHPPVGHHWAPFAVIFDDEVRELLTDDAVAYAMGSYSGPTTPAHRNTTYGGVKHSEYNDLVKTELKSFAEARGLKKIDARELEQFIGFIQDGKSAAGEHHPKISAFNDAIKKTLPKSPVRATKIEDVIAAGRKYMKTSRFRLLAAGAFASALLGDLVDKQIKILEIASTSGHYRRALRALEDGDLATAHTFLTGDRNSLYGEILVKAGYHAAANFKSAVDRIFARARRT